MHDDATIQLSSGAMLDLRWPDPVVTTPEVIAHSLANLCRFNGHCKRFYSVAQHSVMVMNMMEHLGGNALEGLLHDATEAFIGDMPSPIKPLLPDFQALEQRLDVFLRTVFRLPLEPSPLLHTADQAALLVEGRWLVKDGGACFGVTDPTAQTIAKSFEIPVCNEPAKAQELFLHHYYRLRPNGPDDT